MAYGPQNWWPAETPFEVMVGAVLTQNTAWQNVERAIRNLKQKGQLTLEAVDKLEHKELAEIIRPSGYYNIKAQRLKNLCQWTVQQGGISGISEYPTTELRDALLSINGIGPETADDILLYAFNRPVFVIDAYTRRLLAKMQLISGNESYETLRKGFETCLNGGQVLYNEYHALIVRHAKQKCEAQDNCRHCGVETPLPI
jgi:endonuclease-3 related protein